MSVQAIVGSFPQDQLGSTKLVLFDQGGTAQNPAFSSGVTKTVPLQIQPGVTDRNWHVLGWTMTVRYAFSFSFPPGGQFWARLGDMWGGLLVDSPVAPFATTAIFPNDLSTFTKIWSGSSDPIRYVDVTQLPIDENKCSLLGTTYMLPSPLLVYPGVQLGMALVLTPSLWGTAGTPFPEIIVKACKYSVLYDTG